MSDKSNLPAEASVQFDTSSPSHLLQMKKMDLESGLLGRVFGGSKNAPINISGVILVIVVLAGLISLMWSESDGTNARAIEFWKIITPIITMVFGFLFGKHSGN